MATTCEVTAPDTEGSGEQDLTPREDVPSSPDENPGKTRGRKRRRRKARLTGLSQQRQAANARERYRTKSIQDALQQLSCCIPTPVPTPATKLSKIEILRLASQYIEHLTNVLNENDPSGPGASKARPEDDTGTVKTQGSSRARRSRSRQPQDDETVVYLTRRRIKDMKTEDKAHGRRKPGRPPLTYLDVLQRDTGLQADGMGKAMQDRSFWAAMVVRVADEDWYPT
ncbi:PREDICTED: basic helix-loop-helix transcription factor scleraxis-like [Branchiostoma belcheri]|uniref:Basic helix-loop-helix transcription factor scleraxis-like n=1 Tax=Branchiostoma belcheri TaxID=7741 RepID=A0A6P4ZXZ6_BRABE|nr:PREDICTED: basic helix-loop-helix transcription factor scleraxis-like [Branchiostoma belcheri]